MNLAPYRSVSSCRICGNTELRQILDLGEQSLTGVFPGNLDVDVPIGPLVLVKCVGSDLDVCGLVQLRHSSNHSDLYGEYYGYRSGLNESMVRHLRSLVKDVEQKIELCAGDIVLDIGSNDGTLLKSYSNSGLLRVGMDPTGDKFREHYPEDVLLIPNLFTKEQYQETLGQKKAKVITSIAMFYDLENPLSFVSDVYELLDQNGIWVFEQSYLPTMLQMNAYDTVCHEHLEYYALKQITWMFERSNLKILDVNFNPVNGGSFRVAAVRADSDYPEAKSLVESIISNESKNGIESLQRYELFAASVKQHKGKFLEYLETLRMSDAKLAGYGASTKGNVLLQYCGITDEVLPYIIEINPDKFGKYTPGTRIPIISEDEAKSLRFDHLLVLPWPFRDNIIERERQYLEQGGRMIFPLPEIQIV